MWKIRSSQSYEFRRSALHQPLLCYIICLFTAAARWHLHQCVFRSAALRSLPAWIPATTSRKVWRANTSWRRSKTADWANTWRRDFICPWTRSLASSPDPLAGEGRSLEAGSSGATQAVTRWNDDSAVLSTVAARCRGNMSLFLEGWELRPFVQPLWKTLPL